MPRPPSPSRLRWAELLKRVFLDDVLDCPKCHGRMRILAAVMNADAIDRMLRHAGLPAKPPRISPPRAPPQGNLFEGEDSGAWADPPASDDFAA